MYIDLKNEWFQFVKQFSSNAKVNNRLWLEIEKKYSQKNRAYHNLSHIKSMLSQLKSFESEIENLPALKFSIWYHDLVYNVIWKDNEKKSAEFAQKVMRQLGINEREIERSFNQIVITKTHQLSDRDGKDERYMVDFDLEILSRDWEAYKIYSAQIQKEYWMYPLTIYRKGRREAMQRFLEREFIYQTEHYRMQKEEQARLNISMEIKDLL